MLSQPRTAATTPVWQPVGPFQIASLSYGNVTGRVTSIAIDPADATGNTVYLGTTGGGVWKSTNAAGAASAVQFIPLTDSLPVFSLDSGRSAVASLSIGAISVAQGVVLAGTGDTNDALDSYYGSGMLRSPDGGVTWTLMQESHDGVTGEHSFIGLGFSGIAWSSVTPGLVVAAVSDAVEGTLVNAEDATYSVRGLYYSVDAGSTWQMATIKDGGQVVQAPQSVGGNQGGNAATAVVWNPVRQRFYAAVRYHGYYESADGALWTRLNAQPGSALTTGACPANPGTTGSASCPIFRGALAVEPSGGDTFAFTVDRNNLDQGIWRDLCASNGNGCANPVINFGSKLDTGALEQGGGSTEVSQGDYNLSLATMKSGPETLLFAGTLDLFRCSLNTGCIFRNTTNTLNGCSAPARVAPSQHAIVTLPASGGGMLMLGNDGGIWRSLDGVDETASPCSSDDASHFQNLNGGLGSLGEVAGFAQHPSDPNTLLVGMGANGTAGTASAALSAPWPQLAEGEGGAVAIDPANPSNWYISTAAGVSIRLCAAGGLCGASDFAGLPTVGPAQVAQDASLIDAPWILDPAVSSDAIVGTCRVWRGPAADGSAWSAGNVLSQEFAGPPSAACGGLNGFIRSLAAGGPASNASAAAHTGSTVLYAGMAGGLDGGAGAGGHIFSTNASDTAKNTTAWSDLALSPVTNDIADAGVFNPGGFDVSSIVVDAHDVSGKTVYATIMGFTGNGINAPHIYRSLDGGAHWTNISSNLPNAPANGVAVDPNDADTVYVALDTGVYATRQVSTCTTSNCWTVLGAGLPNAPVVQLSAAAGITALDGNAGVLRAATYGRGIWQMSLLSALPPRAPAMSLTPASLQFNVQAVGSASTAQTITVTNSGTAALSISRLATTGDFLESDDCTLSSIAAGSACTVDVSFLPSATGARTGTLTVYGNVSGGQDTAVLAGTGAAPAAVVLNPLNLNFGTMVAGSTSSPQNLTVSNTGGVDAALQSPTVTGDFQMMANTCGGTLPGGVGCTVSVVFTPTGPGTRNGRFTLSNSTGTQTTSLTGIGTTIATDTLFPRSLNFPAQQYNTASALQSVTLTNAGDSPLTLIAAQITAGDFTVLSNCGSSLAGHAACTLAVAFVPSRAGTINGTLSVTDEFRSQTVALTGTGVAPALASLSPASLNFSATEVGQISAAQAITVSNSGGAALVITSVTTNGSFTNTENCTRVALAPNASCTVMVRFSPLTADSETGRLTLLGNMPGGQTTAALTGLGAAPAKIVLTPIAVDFGDVTLGSSSTAQNITISNTGGVQAALQMPTLSGDFKITANTCSGSLAGSTGCAVAVVFTPTASGLSSGLLTVSDSVGTQTATLKGNGRSIATDGLAPLSLSFAAQQLGTSSVPQQVTLTNTGDNTLTLIAAQITGDFTMANGCGPQLGGHGSCTIAVAAMPQAVGARSGALTVSDQFRVQTVALSGLGTAPPGVSLSPSGGLTFAALGVGQSSPPQTVTISNQAAAPLTLTGIAANGDFNIRAGTNTCGASIAAASSCTFQVVFLPTAAGVSTGEISVTDDAAGSPQTLTLRGTGVDFTLSADGAISERVSSGASAVYALLLSSAAGTPGSATFSCSGAPENASCFVTPSGPPLAGDTAVTVTIATGASASAVIEPMKASPSAVWWVVLLPFAIGGLTRGFRRGTREARLRTLRLLASLSVVAGMLLVNGCGSGRTIPPPVTSPTGPIGVVTPSGTYTLTVSAASAGLTRAVSLTLVVQ